MTDLTDEQLGRKWCERNNRSPDHSPRPGLPPWRWVYDDGPRYALPHPLWEVMRSQLSAWSHMRWMSESDAYAAVGAALRELKRKADEIAAVLEGVPT